RRPCCTRWYPRERDSGGGGLLPAPFGRQAQISPPTKRSPPPPPPRGGGSGPTSTTRAHPPSAPSPPPRTTFSPPTQSHFLPSPEGESFFPHGVRGRLVNAGVFITATLSSS